MIAIGIDPGRSGGLVIIDDNNKTATMHKCPSTTTLMANLLRRAQTDAWIENQHIKVAIEKVHAFPTDARNSAFKFGMNYGQWLGAIGALNISTIEVTPQLWMKSYAPLSKTKLERKRQLQTIATDIFSKVYNNEDRITYAVSDAALIALWCLEREKDEQANR
jgi:Holliday junction resolvasome RuvABC endonuclease subunit